MATDVHVLGLNKAATLSFSVDTYDEESIQETTSSENTKSNASDPPLVFVDKGLLQRILSYLSGRQIASVCRVNRFFKETIHASRSLREEMNFAKYKTVYADEHYFSKPEGDLQGHRWKILTHKDLLRLAERLQHRGNRRTDLRVVLDKDFIHTPLTYSKWEKCRPTDIIKLIPDNEIWELYFSMWKIIGSPCRPHAGKDAFYDIYGMRSSSAQKTAALIAFLREKSKSQTSEGEKQHKSILITT